MPATSDTTPTRRDRVRLLALGAMAAAPVLAMAAWAARGYGLRSTVALLLCAALLWALVAGLTRTWARFFAVQFPLFVLGIGFVGYTFAFRSPPGASLAIILAGTSWEEMVGFVKVVQAGPPGLLLVGALAGYLYLVLTLPRLPIFRPGLRRAVRAFLVLLLPATAYVAMDADALIDGAALVPGVGSVLFIGGNLLPAYRALSGKDIVKIAYHASRTGGEEVHVLVIGESARRASWSVYGYRRQTTPFLDTMRGEAIFLEHAHADANLTSWSVPMMLTGMGPEQFAFDKVHGNLVDLAREAGYGTAWLVNQDISISTSVGVAADRLHYPPDLSRDLYGRHARDEVLLPAYRREVGQSGAARFIGIHSNGSHWEYYLRYPPSFQRFGSAKELGSLSMMSIGDPAAAAITDAYDNSVLYTDWFLQQVIAAVRSLEVPVTVTFFPDHGEDLRMLDGTTGHGMARYTPHQFEIPAFVWLNDAYRLKHPERVRALQANAAREVRSHDVFYTLADLMGITWPGANERHSFASEQFVPDTGMKCIAGGTLVAPQVEQSTGPSATDPHRR